MKKKKAVTYAELVIVLTLLGVVSALTLPALRKHSQRNELAKLAQKSYVTIEAAVDNAVLEKGPMRNWDLSNNTVFFTTYITPYLEIIKKKTDSVITLDGMEFSASGCDTKRCLIQVDVNTDNLPNKDGKDIFEFQINKEDNGVKQPAESVQPSGYAGADILRRNNWKFTDALWDCTWTRGSDNSACYN
jgi:type II secretory pathway pseudopilin PulG